MVEEVGPLAGAVENDPAVERIELIRHDYEETATSLVEICEAHGLTAYALRNLSAAQGWRRRRPRRVDVGQMLERMFIILERQVARLDMRLSGEKADEVTTLGNLSRTLERLVALSREVAATPGGLTARQKGIKEELERRINAITKG